MEEIRIGVTVKLAEGLTGIVASRSEDEDGIVDFLVRYFDRQGVKRRDWFNARELRVMQS